MLALVAGPAFAQTQTQSINLNVADLDATANGNQGIPNRGFAIYARVAAPTGVVDNELNIVPETTAANFPDLEDLFAFGGTIELVSTNADAKLYITEIMWGTDASITLDANTAGNEQAGPQWIEIYNEGAALTSGTPGTDAGAEAVLLIFTTNQRVERPTVTIDPDPNTADDEIEYTVHDRVSVVNRFGSRWEPKGQSGRSAVGANGEPVANLVSMYRKRSPNNAKNGYKYKADGDDADDLEDPDGDKFGDGTDGGQWFASVGRLNMNGTFIGTPGAVQQDDGGQVVSAKAPASLPVGSVIINEIYNSETLRWIELHNTGTAAVNVKKYRMHAVHGDKKQDVVFSIPDKDANIPAGGFLVVTNRQPADSILAGGVDLHDSNKFPAGASQLYVVTDVNMPAKGFLLVLRNGNDKTNHEKIVDIAGNHFVKVADDTIVTDVWPLRGWTVPGGRDNADFGDAANSLGQNVGKTYARIEQKSGDNRLHKDHWRMDGTVGGLGYDPGVDLAIAPGTPGYANNAQKANPADITGEVVISEIMYDAGANGNLVQWIELYNASMTESALLNGDWELEIRNIDTDVESYVDAKFDFKDAVILPNQTLLLVSDRSSASDVQSNRVYNLYQQHRNELGLSARKSILLSSVGFHLELRYKDTVVDEAGNVMLDGPRRSVMWALPETGGDMRYSITRGFGTMAFDGTPDDANDGTMASSWITAQSVGSYYGHRDDVGSPGHREGSPLPVSLSSFRPVRDKATGEVVIRWVTESELNNAGFNILRADSKDGAFEVINVKGIIAGHGTTSEKHVYTYTDTTAKPNVVYYYQIEDVSLDGERTTLRTTHLRGNVTAAGKVTTTWGDLKSQK